MLVSFVIPTYDNYEQLADCIQSIKQNVHGDYEIIIVDNGSEARGHTTPANQGMKAANGDYICLLNDDILIPEASSPSLPSSWLHMFSSEMQNGDWFFSPTEINNDGKKEHTMKIAGCCMFISREAYSSLGPLDEQFKIWCGDIDYIRRCEEAGHPPKRLDHVYIHHTTSATTNRAELAPRITQWQREDLEKYQIKWGTNPNEDKIDHGM